jgi:hypothetical protein
MKEMMLFWVITLRHWSVQMACLIKNFSNFEGKPVPFSCITVYPTRGAGSVVFLPDEFSD